MFQDIFVGILLIVAAAAGVWVWWIENGTPKKKKETNTEKTAETE